MSDTITWDRPMLERFRKAYAKAAASKDDVFTFDGHDFVLGYAKSLIEYLDGRLA
jgi:hypothetical protein